VWRSKRWERADELGVNVAGEIGEPPRRDRPAVVEVAAIVVSDPAGFCEYSQSAADETADQLAVVSDLPPRGRSLTVEIFEDAIVFADHPVGGLFHDSGLSAFVAFRGLFVEFRDVEFAVEILFAFLGQTVNTVWKAMK